LDAFRLHSQGLLVIKMFSDESGLEAVWEAELHEEILSALADDGVGEAAGYTESGTGGNKSAGGKMEVAIAYSALDGSEGLVFGNTGIRALLDDANELGRLVANNQLPGFLTNNVDDFADIIVQFAGQMALQKVDYLNLTGEDADFAPEQGILSFFRDGVAVANDNEPLTNRIAA
jgi:hypothetical protein